jgi:ABC-type sugar transport system ATPase subunit
MVSNQSSRPALEIRGICKQFPGVQALKDVSLTLQEGEVHAVIGENGAGKSTLMNIICGLLAADRGEILREAQVVRISSPIVAQRYGIGMVPQELNLVPLFTVMENILLGMQPCRVQGLMLDRRAMARRAEQILARFEEPIDTRARAVELSTAHQQLVQIARALAFGARILIFDEPTSSLTINETEKLFRIILDFRARGGAVFYITHRLEEVLKSADRITVLRDGSKVAELESDRTSLKEMIRHMVGREVSEARYVRTFDRGKARTVLRVQNLSRGREFRNISFELKEGEILGFAGLVGAGRTELVRCVYGDRHPESGSIEVDGSELVHHSPREAIGRRIAYVPDERRRLGIFPAMGVKENMTMPVLRRFTRLFWIQRKRESEASQAFVDRLSIRTPSLGQLIKNLSGGNQQKVILARWLLAGARILILDEPTRGIDVNAKAEIIRCLLELADEGLAIIFISSEHQELIDVADRIIVMHEGQYKGELSAGEATQENIMSLAFG